MIISGSVSIEPGVYFGPSTTVTEIFTSSGTWHCPANVKLLSAEMLLVAGGGGGGWDGQSTYGSGAGGAGGCQLIDIRSTAVPGTSYTVTIGAGGRNGRALNGGNSTAVGFTMLGGGAGGYSNTLNENNAPGNGGSGGGAGHTNTIGGYGTAGQGFNGGSIGGVSFGDRKGGGGGGAAGPGLAAGTTVNNGGPGLVSDITGTTATYATGGNTCTWNGSVYGLGDLNTTYGGGGRGGFFNDGVASHSSSTTAGNGGICVIKYTYIPKG